MPLGGRKGPKLGALILGWTVNTQNPGRQICPKPWFYDRSCLHIDWGPDAALLLHGGQTAHSCFKIPIPIDDTSTCNMAKGDNMHGVDILKETKLIIWDEAPMQDCYCPEAINCTLKDLFKKEGEYQ